MPDDMKDDEFLSYCSAHAETPRCGFAPEHIARLLRLSGDEPSAKEWDTKPNGVFDCDHDQIRALVILARERTVLS